MKRLGALMLVLIMVLVMVAGCTNNESSNGTTTTAPTKAAATAAPTAEPTAAPPDTLDKEGVQLWIYGPANMEEFLEGEDENNNKIINYLREVSGYDIKWQIAPRDNAAEALNLLMASEETPDLVYSGDRNAFARYAQEGILHAIDESLATFAPNVKALIPESALLPATFDGKLYSVVVPQNQESGDGVMARVDWIENLGLDMPETVDDYYDLLKAFQTEKPAGDETIPLSGSGSSAPFGNLSLFAGAYNLAITYDVQDDEVVCTWIQPLAKECLIYMNKLFTEGLLDAEYPVNKDANVQEKVVNGIVGMTCFGWTTPKTLMDPYNEKNPDTTWDYIEPPVGPEGDWGSRKPGPVRVYLYFPVFSEKLDYMMDFLNIYVEDDVLNTVSFGWEGEHYNVVDNQIEATEEAEQIRFRIYYQLWDTKENFLNRVRLKGFSYGYDDGCAWAVNEDISGFAPPIAAVEDNSAALTELYNEYFIKIITGAYSIDKFDEFVTLWHESGGDDTLEALNEWYNTTK